MTGIPAHVRGMPLHAVTEVYGEPGLRTRFLQEIEDFPPDARQLLADTLELVSELHHDQRRVREPYLNHLLRVTIRIIHYYRIRDVDVLCAALLHDAVEDQPQRLGGDTADALDTLARRYNPRVAQLVAAVTNPEYDPERDTNTQYREHVLASLEENPWARVIKFSDFTDNGVGVIHTHGPKVAKSARKYAPLVPDLLRLVGLPDTPLTPEVRALIARQLTTAQARFAMILAEPDGTPA